MKPLDNKMGTPPAAWLCSATGPEAVGELADAIVAETAELPEVARLRVDETAGALRDIGLLGRVEPYEPPPHPGQPGDPIHHGSHVGVTHAVGVHRVAFRSDDPGLVDLIDTTLGDGVDQWATEFFDAHNTASGGVDLFACDEWDFPSRDAMIAQLPAVLNDHAARSHDVLVLHAGAVLTPGGSLIAITGRSDDGKSTLVAALIQAGCDYLGDESIAFGPDLRPFSYPKPLTLDPNSQALLALPERPSQSIGLEEIRSDARRVYRTASPVDAVIACAYRPDQQFTTQRLDQRPALGELCSNVLNLARSGPEGLTALCNLAATKPVWKVVHPSVDVAVPWILGLESAFAVS